MKAIVFEKIQQLRIHEKPIPTLTTGDVLIEMELCGICASDLAALRGDVSDYAPPVVMGHELAGIVVESRHPRCQNRGTGYCQSDAFLRCMSRMPERSGQILQYH